MERTIDIPIVNDMVAEKDECFEIELFEPTGGATLGPISKMAITITNDDGTPLINQSNNNNKIIRLEHFDQIQFSMAPSCSACAN